MDTSFLAFLAISIMVIVTPGPDTALTIRNAIVGGRRGGVATAAGIVVGQLVWVLATSLGIAAIIVASEPVFMVIKYAGAAYLIYLGVQSLLGALRPGTTGDKTTTAPEMPRLSASTALGQGLVSDLSNPKMAAFFTSLLPQFATRPEDAFAPLLVLGLVFCALAFSWLALYACVVARAGDLLRRPRVRRSIEAVSGTLLIAFGLRLAVAQR